MDDRKPTPLVACALLGVVVAATAWVVLWPATALAHTYLTSSEPAADASVTGPLEAVVLTFNQPVDQTIAEVQVLDASGQQLADGAPTINAERVEQALRPLPEHGAYTVRYRVVSADGHPVEGSLSFTYTGPLPAPPTEEPQASAEPTQEALPAPVPTPSPETTTVPPTEEASDMMVRPEAGPPEPAPLEPGAEPAGVDLGDRWVLVMVTVVALASAVAASVYAARRTARWHPAGDDSPV